MRLWPASVITFNLICGLTLIIKVVASSSSSSSEERERLEHLFGFCPDNNGWREAPFMCWRESFHRRDFESALEYCYDDDMENGPFNNLMPVGKLRRFDVMFDKMSSSEENEVLFDENGPFRVNAFKNDRCEWVEYPSGKKIPLHHFPDFDPNQGKPGDTLVWLPKSERLEVAGADEIFHVLCYRPKLGVCQHCAGFEDNDSECSDAGDCWRGKCICDENFAGYKCQLGPTPHLEMMVIGGRNTSDSIIQGVELYDIENRGSCDAARPFPRFTYGAVGAWIDRKCAGDDSSSSDSSSSFKEISKPLVCGGIAADGQVLRNCYSLERNQNWIVEPYMSVARVSSSGITRISDDYWIVAGGSGVNGSVLTSTEILHVHSDDSHSWEDFLGHWHQGPWLDQDVENACLVPISDCETALIGGTRGGQSSDLISIYNWHHDEWRQGPNLELPRSGAGCARIRHPFSDSWMVIVAGGYNSNTDNFLNTVEAWDTETNEVIMLNETLPVPMADQVLLELDEHRLLLSGGQSGSLTLANILSFNFEDGWTSEGNLAQARQDHVGILVPKSYAECLQTRNRLPWSSSSSHESF